MYAQNVAREQSLEGYDRLVHRRAWKNATAVALLVLGVALGLAVEGAVQSPGFVRNNLAVGLGMASLSAGVLVYAWGTHDLNAFAARHPQVEDGYAPDDRQHDARVLIAGAVAGAVLLAAGTWLGGLAVAPANPALGAGVFLLFATAGLWAVSYAVCLASRTPPLWLGDDARTWIDVQAEARRHRAVGTFCYAVMAFSTVVALAMLATPGAPSGYFWLAWVVGGAACGAAALLMGSLRKGEGIVR